MSLIPLPKVPTDNLYKFLALSGVLLIVFGAYWPAYEEDKWFARVDALRERAAVNKARNDIDRSEVWKALEGRMKALTKPTERDVAYAEFAKVKESYEAEIHAEAADRQAWKEEAARNSVEAEVVERMGRQALTRHQICLFLMGLGCLLAVFGFTRWYFKIQVHLDRAYAAGALGKEEKG